VRLRDNYNIISEYESKIVMELIQPGGARLKPTDAVLNEFCRACETLQTQVIGSLLFYNLEASIAWQSKIVNNSILSGPLTVVIENFICN